MLHAHANGRKHRSEAEHYLKAFSCVWRQGIRNEIATEMLFSEEELFLQNKINGLLKSLLPKGSNSMELLNVKEHICAQTIASKLK